MSYGALVAPPAVCGMPSVAMTLPSAAMAACSHSMAASPASVSFFSISLTGGAEKPAKNGAVNGISTRSVHGASIENGSMAPNTRGR